MQKNTVILLYSGIMNAYDDRDFFRNALGSKGRPHEILQDLTCLLVCLSFEHVSAAGNLFVVTMRIDVL